MFQQGAQTVRPQVQMTTTPQMRVIAHPVPTTVPGTPTRPGTQSVQHRFVTVRIYFIIHNNKRLL